MQAPVVLVADDHPLFRAALRLAIERALPGAAVSESGDLAALQAAITAHPEADLVLLDLRMPGVQGFGSLAWLRAEHPSVPVVMVSADEDATTIRRALDFGAAGFIPKSAGLEVLTAALTAVLEGGRWTPELPPVPANDTDAQLARYVDTLDFDRDEVFGIFNRKLELIAAAHLAYSPAPPRCSLCWRRRSPCSGSTASYRHG